MQNHFNTTVEQDRAIVIQSQILHDIRCGQNIGNILGIVNLHLFIFLLTFR